MRTLARMLVLLVVSALSSNCTADPAIILNEPWPVATLSIEPASPVLAVGTALQLSAVPRDQTGAIFVGLSTTWKTSNESIATVGAGGIVNALAPGSVQIIATVEGKSDSSLVTIDSSLTSPPSTTSLTQLVLTPSSSTITPGGTRQFAVSGTWSDGSSTVPVVTYTATGGTIGAAGLYTAGVSPGEYRVIATHLGGTLADTATVTISPPTPTTPTLTTLVLTPASITLAAGGTSQFAVSGKWSDSSNTVPAVIYSATGGTISSGGLYVAGTTAGTFRVIATQHGGTLADTSTVTISPPPPAQTLRALANARGFEIGVAVRDSPFVKDAQYKAILTAQYNSINTEDATDFWPIHPGPTQYNFGPADALAAYAQANGMKFHGHTLIWGSWIPTWVTSGGYSRDSLFGVMKSHITTVVTRYKGQALSWDVLNEMLDNWPGTTVKPSFWLTQLGPEYMDSAFVWARRADPGAKLYIDEYFTEFSGQKQETLFALVQGMRSRGVPVDGVGFQMHLSTAHPGWPGYDVYKTNPIGAQVYNTFIRFANAGYDIRITELDAEVADTAGPAALEKQGQVYRDVLDACLRVSRCKELTTWGLTDKYSWIPAGRPGFGRGLPFDASYRPKPAFDSLLARLGRP